MKRVLAVASALVLLGLTGTISVEAATTAAQGPLFCGAANMVHDDTMFSGPMSHMPDQGLDGMSIAVHASGCK
jgi:hypothetical protein